MNRALITATFVKEIVAVDSSKVDVKKVNNKNVQVWNLFVIFNNI